MRLILISGRSPKTLVLVVAAAAVVCIGVHGGIVECLASQSQSPAPTQAAAPQASPTPKPEEAGGWHKNIDSFGKIISALAIIVGGFWAWLKFFRGRTFRSRLELSVSGEIIQNGANQFLKVSMQMKNVGLSQVKLKKEALYLDVFLIEAERVKPAAQLYSAMWNTEPRTFEVFQDHGWVEPAEEITDQLLFQLPESEQFAARLKLTVNSPSNSRILFQTEGTRWSATSIIDCRPPRKPDESTTNQKGTEK